MVFLDDMASTRGERLRQARLALFSSSRAAAKALGIPVATFNAHERAEQPGGRDYGIEDAQRYARRFKVKPEWLMMGGPQPNFEAEAPDERPPVGSPALCRVVGYVGAGDAAHYYAVNQGDMDEEPAPDGATKDTVAVEIKGNSLGPFFDKALAFYDNVQRPVTADLVGRLCIVGLEDGRILIKKLRRGKGELFTLISQTEEPIRDVALEWAARVIDVRPR